MNDAQYIRRALQILLLLWEKYIAFLNHKIPPSSNISITLHRIAPRLDYYHEFYEDTLNATITTDVELGVYKESLSGVSIIYTVTNHLNLMGEGRIKEVGGRGMGFRCERMRMEGKISIPYYQFPILNHSVIPRSGLPVYEISQGYFVPQTADFLVETILAVNSPRVLELFNFFSTTFQVVASALVRLQSNALRVSFFPNSPEFYVLLRHVSVPSFHFIPSPTLSMDVPVGEPVQVVVEGLNAELKNVEAQVDFFNKDGKFLLSAPANFKVSVSLDFPEGKPNHATISLYIYVKCVDYETEEVSTLYEFKNRFYIPPYPSFEVIMSTLEERIRWAFYHIFTHFREVWLIKPNQL